MMRMHFTHRSRRVPEWVSRYIPVCVLAAALVSLLLAQPAGGATPDLTRENIAEAFVRANTAYENGQYTEAVDLFEKIIAAGFASGDLHYNLGNAHLRAGQIGKAIASYHRSKSFMPRNEDLVANLEFARKSIKDDIEYQEAGPLLQTIFFWHYSLSRNELTYALIIFNLLLWIVLIVRLYQRDIEILRWAQILLVVAVVGTGTSSAIRWMAPSQVAIVQAGEISVHSGTSRDTVVRFNLHEGSELQVTQLESEWVRIALPDDTQGWVHKDDVSIVQL